MAKTGALLRLIRGRHAGWTRQNRRERSVTWGEAIRLLWPQTVLGGLAFACFAAAGWTAALWALPFAGGLLAAIPLCVLTAEPRLWTLAARAADRGGPGRDQRARLAPNFRAPRNRLSVARPART